MRLTGVDDHTGPILPVVFASVFRRINLNSAVKRPVPRTRISECTGRKAG